MNAARQRRKDLQQRIKTHKRGSWARRLVERATTPPAERESEEPQELLFPNIVPSLGDDPFHRESMKFVKATVLLTDDVALPLVKLPLDSPSRKIKEMQDGGFWFTDPINKCWVFVPPGKIERVRVDKGIEEF